MATYYIVFDFTPARALHLKPTSECPWPIGTYGRLAFVTPFVVPRIRSFVYIDCKGVELLYEKARSKKRKSFSHGNKRPQPATMEMCTSDKCVHKNAFLINAHHEQCRGLIQVLQKWSPFVLAEFEVTFPLKRERTMDV